MRAIPTYTLMYQGRYIEALESALLALLQPLVNMVMVIGVSLVSDVWRTKLRHSMLVFYSNCLCTRVGPKGNSFQRWIRSRARAKTGK